MKDKLLQRLEYYEEREEWQKAIAVNNELLAKYPNDHWLLTRQGSNYYEALQYRTALKYSKKALKLAPHCPLVLWDHANVLDMLSKKKEARLVYRRLLRRGVEHLAYGECGEGVRWAEALLADCRYRIGMNYADEGRKKLAIRHLRQHVSLRKPGLPSIYPLKKVRKELADLEKSVDAKRRTS
jgi:tetratricopeptide (TPR) repeat protein